MIKQTVNGIWHGALHAALREEMLAQVALFGGEDFRVRQSPRANGRETQ
jgi:hypothetical protein